MSKRRLRSRVAHGAIATVVVLSISGVVGIAAIRSGGRVPQVLSRYLQGPYGPATVRRFVADLAHVGIAVFEPGSSTPIDPVTGRVAPVRLTLDQAGAAALGISRHAGISGARLDSLVHLARGRLVVPMGAIVAGWAKRARTPAGTLARRILGRPAWRRYRRVVFPDAVLLLFAADVGSHLPVGAGSPASDPVAASAADSPCTAVDGFIRDAIDSFFRSIGRLRTDPKTIRKLFGNGLFGDIIAGVGDVLSWSVNTVVDAAQQVVINGYKFAIGTVTSALASVAGAAEIAGSVATALEPWAATITTGPKNPTHKGVGAGIPGTLSLDVTAPGSQLQWPGWIVSCASLFNVPLPTLTPKDADVTWNLSQQDPGGLVVERSNSGPLNDQGKAQLRFETTTESPEVATGDYHIGVVVPYAHIHRTDLDKLQQRLTDGLLADLPDLVKQVVGPALRGILGSVLSQLQAKLSKLRDVDVAGLIAVGYHTPPEKKRKPGGGKTGSRGGTELRYPLPNACSLLSLGDVAAVMVPGPIAGPKRAPTVHLGPLSQSGCNWQATYLPSPFPPGAVSVTNFALRSPSVKTATKGWAHGRPPGAVRTTVLGHPAYYRARDAGGYKSEIMFALVGNVVLKVLTNRVDEATVKSLMRAMISHLPSPTRVGVKP